MKIMNRFNSKILLFGEYGIIKGSKGLALPFDSFFGEIVVGESKTSESMRVFVQTMMRSSILKREIDFKNVENDIEQGLVFKSNIPQGFGLGSSGALCAALFDQYSLNFKRKNRFEEKELSFIQEILSIMESTFHGTSSGLDPLISYMDTPLLIEKGDKVSVIKKPELSVFGQFYLLDTKIQRKTSPLVHQFLKDCSDEKYLAGIQKYMSLTNLVIDNLLDKQVDSFAINFREISRLQYLYFESMIPASLKEVWLRGLESRDYFMKLCGAGGGGFFLVFTSNGNVPSDFDLLRLT